MLAGWLLWDYQGSWKVTMVTLGGCRGASWEVAKRYFTVGSVYFAAAHWSLESVQ